MPSGARVKAARTSGAILRIATTAATVEAIESLPSDRVDEESGSDGRAEGSHGLSLPPSESSDAAIRPRVWPIESFSWPTSVEAGCGLAFRGTRAT